MSMDRQDFSYRPPNRLLGALALAGLASAASAAAVTLHFELDGDPLSTADVVYTEDPVTWTVYASFTGYPDPGAYFGGFVGSFVPVVSTDNGVLGSVSNLTSLMQGSGTAASGDGVRVDNVNVFHSALLQTNDPSNPIAIFSFDLTVDGVTGAVDPDAPIALTYAPDGLASVFPDAGIFSLPDEYTEINVISDRLFVPSPGVAGVVGPVGLALARRRRTG